jgi:hypothetical protein
MNFVNPNAAAATPEDFAHAAATIECEVAAFRAVVAVETGGRGFDAKGRPKALFEPHIFYRLLDGDKRREATRAGLAYRKWGTKPYPKESYPRIVAACRIDMELALQATSWGLPQILGSNHRAAGYPSAVRMVEAFCEGEDVQLAAMARFIVAERLSGALERKDWAAFARRYNGPRYATHGYHTKLARAYAHFSDVAAAALPEPATPEAKNRAQSGRLGTAAKSWAVVAVSTWAAAPLAVTAARVAEPNGLGGVGIAIVLLLGGAAFAIVSWRSRRRVECFERKG